MIFQQIIERPILIRTLFGLKRPISTQETRNQSAPESLNIGDKRKLLHINAALSEASIVFKSSQHLLQHLNFPFVKTQRNLWSDSLPPFDQRHVSILYNPDKGTAENEALVAPIHSLIEELNITDYLVISTPMWNFNMPYVLKKYLDTGVHPYIASKLKQKAKTAVYVTSSAGLYPEDSERKEFLTDNLKQLFGTLGFNRSYKLRIEGTFQLPMDDLLKKALLQAEEIASELNSG